MDLTALRERVAERDWQRTEPDPAAPVRFAVVGLGWWACDEALPAMRAEPGVEPTVLVSGDPAKAERVAADLETDPTVLDYEAYEDGAAADEYDAAYVATPNGTHLDYASPAAAVGNAVLVEKPLEATVERAEELVDALADVPAMTAYRLQTEPATRLARELVREGEIGEPTAVLSHMTGELLALDGPEQWRLDPELVGRGASVTDLGIYPLNTTRFVLDREPLAAHAATFSHHEAFDDVPDERAGFLLEYEGGITGSFASGQNSHYTTGLRVICTKGELVLEPGLGADRPRRLAIDTYELDTTVEFPGVDQMREEVAYFADCLRDGRDPAPDAEHGLADLRTIEAVYDAAERGERVAVER